MISNKLVSLINVLIIQLFVKNQIKNSYRLSYNEVILSSYKA